MSTMVPDPRGPFEMTPAFRVALLQTMCAVSGRVIMPVKPASFPNYGRLRFSKASSAAENRWDKGVGAGFWPSPPLACSPPTPS